MSPPSPSLTGTSSGPGPSELPGERRSHHLGNRLLVALIGSVSPEAPQRVLLTRHCFQEGLKGRPRGAKSEGQSLPSLPQGPQGARVSESAQHSAPALSSSWKQLVKSRAASVGENADQTASRVTKLRCGCFQECAELQRTLSLGRLKCKMSSFQPRLPPQAGSFADPAACSGRKSTVSISATGGFAEPLNSEDYHFLGLSQTLRLLGSHSWPPFIH